MNHVATAPEPFLGLALQLHCRAVNRLGVDEARQAMLAAIDHAGQLIAGSAGFLATFSGQAPKLVVLPEYFLSGFPMGESMAEWQAKGCVAMDGPEYEALAKLASDRRIHLAGNLYELDPAFPALYFQTSFLLGPTGEVLLRYRRLISMFAPTPHDVLDDYLDRYGADALFPVAATELGRVGCVASEEILFPEISRALALRGAEVLCHSSSEAGSPQATPKNLAKRARACENLVYVVSANSAGIGGLPFPAQSTDGHSQVVDYRGKILGEAGPGESMCGNGEIDVAALRRERRRPGMSNLLARQRLELFRDVYGGESVHAANGLTGTAAPARSHFQGAVQDAIDSLVKRGII